MVSGSTAIFAAADIAATVDYYKNVLGFDSSWTWGEPPTFAGVSWGGMNLMFNLQPDLAAKVAGHEHWINADDVDQLYEQHRERGAKIVSPIEDKPWGVREYTVEDPNGYRLRIAGPLVPTKKSSALPDGVRVERRKPTEEEFAAVTAQAFGSASPSGSLERTWQGVVALSAEGKAIGVARIMYDAPGWFSVWDVAVLPDWQGRRVGTAVMQEALAAVRQESPGANVYLFTFKHGFYERLGFEKGPVSMRKPGG